MTADAEVDIAFVAFYGVPAGAVASTVKATQPAPPAAATFETEHTT